MEDGFGLEGGAERGERGEWGAIEQHIGSRKPIDTRFWRSLSFWGGDVLNSSYNLAVDVLFLCVFFQPCVYKSNSPLFIALFAQFRLQHWSGCVCKEVVVNVIMYMCSYDQPWILIPCSCSL